VYEEKNQHGSPAAGAACAFIHPFLAGCAKSTQKDVFFNEMVDFASIQTVAVMPFQNLTNTDDAAERVRDVFMGMLLATEAVYVLPPGEVFRGISRVGMADPAAPSIDEIKAWPAFSALTWSSPECVREYQTLRSGASTWPT
jgi:polysaccharide biosynthesis protein PelC